MYYCLNCEDRFVEFETDRWGEVEADVCPYCKIDDYIKLVPCKQCSDLKEDNLDPFCESCRQEVAQEISDCIQEQKMRWDAELVEEELVKFIEDM